MIAIPRRVSGPDEDRERLPLACGQCGNRCRTPFSRSRAYACPRCGQRLALPEPRTLRRPAASRRLRRELSRALLVGVAPLTAVALAVYAGSRQYTAAASGTTPPPARAIMGHLTSAEAQNYTFRLHQLEQDLARDGTDFAVLERLGALHLEMAECQVERRDAHLRWARHYLLRAATHPMFRADMFRIHRLMEAADSPNPGFALPSAPGEAGFPPPRDDEEWIRLRIGYLQEQLSFQPRNSRLLRRLAESYAALARVVNSPEAARSAPWEGFRPVSDASQARRLAQRYFDQAIQCAVTHEALVLALHGEAEMFREKNDPARAAQCLERLLALQPNNWLAAMEIAALSQRLGRSSRALHYQAQAERWRTPRWI